MTAPGRHLLLELQGCEAARLDDEGALRALALRAVEAVGARCLGLTSHRFEPHGVSVLLALAESHLSLHTWPELGYAAADLFTCGALDPSPAAEVLARGLGAQGATRQVLRRGDAPDAAARELAVHPAACVAARLGEVVVRGSPELAREALRHPGLGRLTLWAPWPGALPADARLRVSAAPPPGPWDLLLLPEGAHDLDGAALAARMAPDGVLGLALGVLPGGLAALPPLRACFAELHLAVGVTSRGLEGWALASATRRPEALDAARAAALGACEVYDGRVHPALFVLPAGLGRLIQAGEAGRA